jgi:hypothetical protein
MVLGYEHLTILYPGADEVSIRSVLRDHLHEDAGGREMAESTLGPRQKSETAELMDCGLKSRANLAASGVHIASKRRSFRRISCFGGGDVGLSAA